MKRVGIKKFPVFFAVLFLLLLPCCKSTQSPPPENPTVRYMTWNVYLGKGDMNGCMDIIEEYDPEILHFQEAFGAYESLVSPLLAQREDYAILNTEIAEYECSTPVIYDSERFKALEYGVEFLKDSYNVNGTKTLSWAVFEFKENGKIFFDINFHGAICKSTYEGFESYTPSMLNQTVNAWRVGNVNQILEKIAALTEKYGDCPSVVMGDCNFDSASPAYAVMLDAGYSDAEMTALNACAEEGLTSTHSLGYPCNQGLTIDHIFGNGVNFLSHNVIRTQAAYSASDHCPVTAQIEFQ